MTSSVKRVFENPLFYVVLIFLFIRFPEITKGVKCFYGGDDFTYISLAAKTALGEFVFPHNVDYVHPAILRYSFIMPLAFLYTIFGIGDLAVYILQIFLTTLTAISIYHFVKILTSDIKMATIASLSVAFLPVHIFLSSVLYPDAYAALFCISSLTLLIYALKSTKVKYKYFYALLAGIVYGLAINTTTGTILYLPILGLTYLFYTLKKDFKINYVQLKLIPVLFFGLLILLFPLKFNEFIQTERFYTKTEVRFHKFEEEGLFTRIYNLTKTRLTHPDVLKNTFGIAQQYILGAKYYKNKGPLNLIWFSLGVLLLVRYKNQIKIFRELIFLLLLTFSLYFIYEIISPVFIRKLYRYYTNLHLLVAITGGIGISLLVREKHLLSLLKFLAIILGCANILIILGVSNPLYLSVIAALIILGYFFYEYKSKRPLDFSLYKLLTLLFILWIPFNIFVFNGLRSDLSKYKINLSKVESLFPANKINHIYTNSNLVVNVLNYQTEFEHLKNLNNYQDVKGIPPNDYISYLNEANQNQLEENSLLIVPRGHVTPLKQYGVTSTFLTKKDIERLNAKFIHKEGNYSYYKVGASCKGFTKEITNFKIESSSARELHYSSETTGRIVVNQDSKDIIYEANSIMLDSLDLNLNNACYRGFNFDISSTKGKYLVVRIFFGNNFPRVMNIKRYLPTTGFETIEIPLPKNTIKKMKIYPSTQMDTVHIKNLTVRFAE